MYVYAETVEKLDCTCAVWGKPGLGQGRGEGGEMGGTKIKTVVLRVGSHSTLCITVPAVIAGRTGETYKNNRRTTVSQIADRQIVITEIS